MTARYKNKNGHWITKHNHHIIPKHAGGTNDPENLVELTLEEHAEVHLKRFEKYGQWQDETAWKALSGQITFAEARGSVSRQAALDAWKDPEYRKTITESSRRTSTKLWKDPEYRAKQLPKLREAQKLAIIAACTPEARKKQKESLAKIGHQQGEKNSQYGTMWITDGAVDKRIKKGDPIQVGFKPGRKYNPNYGKNFQKSASGKHWYTDGKTEMIVFSETPLPSGFKRGRIVHPKMRRG
jgi:hypothetical protein